MILQQILNWLADFATPARHCGGRRTAFPPKRLPAPRADSIGERLYFPPCPAAYVSHAAISGRSYIEELIWYYSWQAYRELRKADREQGGKEE